MLKDLFKKLLYSSGALGLYHRLRNGGVLTVVMFHRTLPPGDPRHASCDPDYTLEPSRLAQSLEFFRKHYHVVSLQQVLDCRRHNTALPPRPLLITFDDGWADNVDHALPELQRAGMPAVMFVVADAVGQRQPFFQERLISAWRRGRLSVATLAGVLRPYLGVEATGVEESIGSLRGLVARLELLDPAERSAALAAIGAGLDDSLRHMVDREELLRLEQGGVALGLHGKTHVPMTRADDLDAELAGARVALAGQLERTTDGLVSMSFPHGAHDAAIAGKAHEAGYELVFTSVPVLNPVGDGIGWLLGRTGYETGTVVDRQGNFRPDLLALYLFRKSSQVLAA